MLSYGGKFDWYAMSHGERQPDAQESRGVVALTVAWMLTCLSTAVATFMVLALRLLMLALPAPAGGVHPLGRIAGVLLFVALTTGLLCLLLTFVTLRMRQIAPPRAVTISAVLIAAAPIVLLVLLSLLERS
jgi:hypothetical protein